MTISSTTSKVQSNGNGATTAFPFTFKTFVAGDLDVILTSTLGVDTTKTITTHYTVSLNSDQNNNPGGTVTMLTAPASGEVLTIRRTVDALQETDITNGGGFYPEVIEDALDRATMLAQQNAETLGRALVYPASDTASTTLPSATDRANKALVFDADGDPSVSTYDVAAQASAAAASAAAASASASTATTQASNASTSASNAATSETNAATSATTATAATEASATIKYLFDSTTSMADPGTGDLRLNNATLASVTAIALSALAASTGNPDFSDYIVTWDDSTNTNKGTLVLREAGASTFAVFTVTGVTDNSTWLQLAVTHVASGGTLSASDVLFVGFSRSGDVGATGATGATGPAGSISDGDKGDITVSGSGATWTIDNDVVTYAKMQNVSATDKLLGRSSSGAGDVEEIACTAGARATLAAASPETIVVAVSDESTAITTGTSKVSFRMPFAMTLASVRASLSTASSSGNPAIDINEAGVSIFSTTLTIDANEKTSTTAATAAVISDSSLADDAEMTIDIDTAGTGAKGLKVYLIGRRT